MDPFAPFAAFFIVKYKVRMKVSTRIILGFAILVLLAVGPLAYQVSLIHRMQDVNEDLAQINFEAGVIALEMQAAAAALDEFSEKHFINGDPIYETLLNDAITEFAKLLAELDSTGGAQKDRVEIDSLKEDWNTFEKTLAATKQESGPGEVERLPIPLTASIDRLRFQTEVTYNVIRLSIREQVNRAARVGATAEQVSWIAGAISLLLAVVVAGLIVSAISTPLHRLTQTTRLIAKGQFWHRLPETGKDEFSDLARDFNAMSQRLGELDEMKKDFVSHVSHELKAPLASIRQVVHLLLQEIPGPLDEQQKRLLHLCSNSAERLSAMVGNLLDISRMEAGTMEYEIDKHDLVTIVRGVAEEFQVQADEKGVRIRVEAAPNEVFVECDRSRMTQVVGNLFENALKFSPSNTEIIANVELSGDRAVLSVTDSGPGVPEGHKDRIFMKFHQVKQGKKLSGQGVGLGLAICKTIVEAHHGSIWVDDNPSGGSIFKVTLHATAKSEVLEYR
ncbi:MAG: HAMP domain-containing protein [Acidobacteria bacterium]|nr:HAMP domain-containing protein [Acidobacteriota bacterium]